MPPSSTAVTTQVNTRVDAAVKQQADEVLALAGSTAAELVRSVMAKVARGMRDYEEVANVLEGSTSREPDEALEAGWALADSLYATIDAEGKSLASDARSWDEVYSEARSEHLAEKELSR